MVQPTEKPRLNLIMRNIEARAEELGLSLEAVSRKADLHKTYLRKTIERNGMPRLETLKKIADALDIPVSRLSSDLPGSRLARTQDGEGATDTPTLELPTHSPLPPATGAVPVIRGDARLADVDELNTLRMPKDVPVYGTAAGSHLRGAFQFSGGVLEYVRRPPALMGSSTAYAFYVEGYSMAPEHNPGDLRFATTIRPPRIGDSVVVQVKTELDGEIEAIIGHLVKQTGSTIFIGKLNPEATVELKAQYIVAIHKVLTTNELFGV